MANIFANVPNLKCIFGMMCNALGGKSRLVQKIAVLIFFIFFFFYNFVRDSTLITYPLEFMKV